MKRKEGRTCVKRKHMCAKEDMQSNTLGSIGMLYKRLYNEVAEGI